MLNDKGFDERLIDGLLTSQYMSDFVARNFPISANMIKRADLYKAFKTDRNTRTLHYLGKTVFFYALRRDGWTDHRTSKTWYMIRPNTEKPKRGKRKSDDVISELKQRISELEQENEQLKRLLNSRN